MKLSDRFELEKVLRPVLISAMAVLAAALFTAAPIVAGTTYATLAASRAADDIVGADESEIHDLGSMTIVARRQAVRDR